jgi:hypothetical protein
MGGSHAVLPGKFPELFMTKTHNESMRMIIKQVMLFSNRGWPGRIKRECTVKSATNSKKFAAGNIVPTLAKNVGWGIRFHQWSRRKAKGLGPAPVLGV